MQRCLKIKVFDQQFDLTKLDKTCGKEIEELLGTTRFVPLKELNDKYICKKTEKVDSDVCIYNNSNFLNNLNLT